MAGYRLSKEPAGWEGDTGVKLGFDFDGRTNLDAATLGTCWAREIPPGQAPSADMRVRARGTPVSPTPLATGVGRARDKMSSGNIPWRGEGRARTTPRGHTLLGGESPDPGNISYCGVIIV